MLEQIRKFETSQPAATAPVVREYVEVLRMAQAILLNVSAEALRSATIKDEDTPTLFLPHTVIDDLRQAELNLLLGYTVAVAHAMRDAVEATAMCALLSVFPGRATGYFEGKENSASQVRKDLEDAGLNKGVLASLWFHYEFLSQFTHPNMERLAHVMDERLNDDGSVVRTYNAGGTNVGEKLQFMGVLAVSCLPAVVLLLSDSLGRFLETSRSAGVAAATRDLTAHVRPLVVRTRRPPPPDRERTAYDRRIRGRFAKQYEVMRDELAKLEADPGT